MMDCCTRKMKRFIPLSVVTSFISFLSFALRQSSNHYTSHRKQKPKEVKKRPEGQLRVRKLHLLELRKLWSVGFTWRCELVQMQYLLRRPARPTNLWNTLTSDTLFKRQLSTRFLKPAWVTTKYEFIAVKNL